MIQLPDPPSAASLGLAAHLRDGRARSRGRLADLSGIARSTAGIRVDELIAAGLVAEESGTSYTGGRPSTKVRLVARARVVLAGDLGPTHARLAIVDLLGDTIAAESRSLTPDDAPEVALEWMVDTATRLLDNEGVPRNTLAAVSIGLAAPIEAPTGRPVDPPVMPRWRDFDIRAWIRERLDVPVLVEKDVNMMALGEYTRHGAPLQNLLFAKVSTGIGSGIISGGRLHRGEQGLAGDIGHVRVERLADTPCRCGNRGCLEAVASGPALAAALTALGTPASSSRDVIDLVRAGNLDAIQLVRQAGRDVGGVLAVCVSLFNPSAIILGGLLAATGEHLLAGVREAVYARSMPLATRGLAISTATPDAGSALAGAAALALDTVLGPR